MLKKLLLIVMAMTPLAAQAQQMEWRFDGAFPADTFANNVHGLAVDANNRLWVQAFSATGTLTFPDTIVVGTSKFLNLPVRQLFVYEPDGSQASFSPITILNDLNGNPVDTLGTRFLGTTVIGGKTYPLYDVLSGRGLRASRDGETIYVSQFDRLLALRASDGALIGSAIPGGGSLTAAATDDAGNVYIANVVGGNPIRIFSSDLSAQLSVAVDTAAGFSRSFEVSPNGLEIYWTGYTQNSVHRYTRPDMFASFDQVPDTLLKGIPSEATTIHPVTGDLYVGSGAGGKGPNQYVGFQSNYQPLTWYAFDTSDFATDFNPAPQDSIVYAFTVDQRALAFSRDGEVAYAGSFGVRPALAKYIRAVVNAVEPTGVVPDGLTLARNFPNPFAGTTTITFALPVASQATLKVYDTLGREIATLVDGLLAADTYNAEFDASGLSSGLYFYRLQAAGNTLSGTMTVLK